MNWHLLLLAIGAMAAGAAILFFAIGKLLGVVRNSVVARMPAVAHQALSFERAGTYVLHIEGPRLATALSRAGFSLREAAGGTSVRSWPIVFRTTTAGFSTVRTSVRGFAVERAGRYELFVDGIEPRSDASKHALVFARPYGAAMVTLILAIVLGGFCLIGGMVFAGLELAGRPVVQTMLM